MGNKAHNLQVLRQKGFRVPPLVVIPSRGITEEMLLERVAYLPRDTRYFAVRSSAAAEDSDDKAMAGYFYSAVGVAKYDLYKEYTRVVQSLGDYPGDVIVQVFIPSTTSGVVFSNRGDGLAVINALPGLCKAVVEGHACDEYLVDPQGKVLNEHLAPAKEGLFFEDGRVLSRELSPGGSLNLLEIKQLIRVTRKIERVMGGPQDIEWCFLGRKLHVLQSRPITRSLVDTRAKHVYDSANIAESYSGIVMPLTISFATRIYAVVYQNLLVASGLPRRVVKKYPGVFHQMISTFYGRMYYNMNNWYLMMSLMPGYKRNKRNLEDMITSNTREVTRYSLSPPWYLGILYPFIVVFKLLVMDRVTRRFQEKVRHMLTFYRTANLHEWELDRCKQAYEHLSGELLEQWHIPVENDFMVMTYLGILKKRVPDDQLKELMHFGNVSTMQVEALSALARDCSAVPAAREAILAGNAEGFELVLENNPGISHRLNQYFEVYGGRFANELKLESADISEDKTKLLALLGHYMEKPLSIPERPTSKVELGRLDRWLLGRFKKYAARRESLRLARSNCFGVVRALFNQMGHELERKGLIDSASQVFYLEIDEVFAAGISLGKEELMTRIHARETEHLFNKTVNPKTWFVHVPGEDIPLVDESANHTGQIEGRPCTPGVVEGKARVFEEFYMPTVIDFDIIVAKHTDPGWTPLIGLAKGLVIEHGGILSHAAIVSRELGIPTVIGASMATRIIPEMSRLRVNGSTGLVSILNSVYE